MSTSALDAFHVGTGTHLLSGLFSNYPRFWKRISRWETKLLQSELEPISIDRPIYVTGLARSGTTLLLEILASHPEVATHQYRDFPGLLIPTWWSKSQAGSGSATPTERAHGDRLMVTPSSPEAMEEMLWMACLENLHDPQHNQVLDGSQRFSEFDRIYIDHLRKLLLVRKRSRYASKGNYNLTRLGYLKSLFPEARFLVPIREPVGHIASLMKQDTLFRAAQARHPRAVTHLQRVGHFEFGIDLRLINVGDTDTVNSIFELWDAGQTVRGWARYWAMIYGWLHRYLQQEPEIAAATHIVRYDELCDCPERQLVDLLGFVELEDDGLIDQWAPEISSPSYYKSGFTEQDLEIIALETDSVASDFGWN